MLSNNVKYFEGNHYKTSHLKTYIMLSVHSSSLEEKDVTAKINNDTKNDEVGIFSYILRSTRENEHQKTSNKTQTKRRAVKKAIVLIICLEVLFK